VANSAPKLLSRIGLGSVQFGTLYGISNHGGRPGEAEVAAILARAVDVGVGYIDTAPAYGNAEILVGKHLPTHNEIRIVTKLQPVAEAVIEARHGATLLERLERSLENLRVDKIYGVLLHDAGDLAKPGFQHLIEALSEARGRGWVDRIGVSIYDESDLALAESRFQPNLVQLPLNALDRRLIQSGVLLRLKARGVEIHARSIFLQGLLLMCPNEMPEFFAPVRRHIVSLRQQWVEAGLTALGGCLAFASQSDVDAVIVGVNRLCELDDIVAAVKLGKDIRLQEPTASIDPLYLDPSCWPILERRILPT
jgi:aryl-alcohol dehydrogenase-like predicted oxidoreductase